MKLRWVVAAVLIVVMASVCIRLGFWQLSRLEQKRALNAGRTAALAAPAHLAGTELLDEASLPSAKLQVRGRYDETRQFLLSARAHEGSPGVHVVTPLRLEGGGAILVNRGWLYTGDATYADPFPHSEPGEVAVVGLAAELPRGEAGFGVRALRSDSLALWSMRRLDYDSVSARLPYSIAPWVVNQLPGEDVPAMPARVSPQPENEMTHVGYAAQWFLFAAILLVGPAVVALHRRRGTRESNLQIPDPPRWQA